MSDPKANKDRNKKIPTIFIAFAVAKVALIIVVAYLVYQYA